jgi:excisionase family DNA binding protein
MTAPAVADYLDASPEWVREVLAAGVIPGAFKINGRWRVPQDAVDAWIDAGQPEPAEPSDVVPYRPYPRVMRDTTGAGVP